MQTRKIPTPHLVQLRRDKNMAATGSTLPMAAMTDLMHRHYTSMKEVCQMGDILKPRYSSPCLTCTRVPDPRACDNKECRPWRQWFIDRWALIHAYGRYHMEQTELRPTGVVIGGKVYTQPDRVRNYLSKDPCEGCICSKDLCSVPCRNKRIWLRNREDVFL